MLFGEMTFINPNYDIYVIMANLFIDLAVAFGLVTMVFASKKMSEKLRDSVYWMLFTIILASFFRNYVTEFLIQIFANLGSVFYYLYVILTKRLYAQLLAVIVYAALVAYPIIYKVIGTLIKGRPIKLATLRQTNFFTGRGRLNAGVLSKPSFHFIS